MAAWTCTRYAARDLTLQMHPGSHPPSLPGCSHVYRRVCLVQCDHNVTQPEHMRGLLPIRFCRPGGIKGGVMRYIALIMLMFALAACGGSGPHAR